MMRIATSLTAAMLALGATVASAQPAPTPTPTPAPAPAPTPAPAPAAASAAAPTAGLRVETLRAGTGRMPTAMDHVVVNYVGKLEDGTQFDAADNVPFATAPDSPLIPGFLVGLQRVQAGGQYRIHIPAALGYGDRATGPIPANSNLVFDVTVQSVLSPEAMRDSLPQLYDGLRIETLNAGTGAFPTADQYVVLSYVGTLEDGTKFDEFADIPFPHGVTSGLIPGFARALGYVQAGGHYRFHIPAAQGYGPQASGPIPANANLIFDIRVSRFVSQPEAVQMMQALRARMESERTP